MPEEPIQYNGLGFSLERGTRRFVLPPTFRKVVKQSSGNKPLLCLDMSDRYNCLIGFGLSRTAMFDDIIEEERLDAERSGQPFDRALRRIQINGFADAPYDESGRFVLPPYLADLACISDQMFFQGIGDSFLMWAPEEHYKMPRGWEKSQAACRQLAKEALAKARKT